MNPSVLAFGGQRPQAQPDNRFGLLRRGVLAQGALRRGDAIDAVLAQCADVLGEPALAEDAS